MQVADEGPGIPAAHLPHIFDRYYRVLAGRARPHREARAWGWRLRKGIVEAHGGRIAVRSPPEAAAAPALRSPSPCRWRSLAAPATEAAPAARRSLEPMEIKR